MNREKIYKVTLVERIWHGINALGITLLMLSGLNIHFARDFNLFGSLLLSIEIHNLSGIVVSLCYLIWLSYILISRRIKYYKPDSEDGLKGIVRQARFYYSGIFRGEVQPFSGDRTRKFNPIQKWTYAGMMLIILPLQIISGLTLLYFIENWSDFHSGWVSELGVVHTLFAILIIVFYFVHIYSGSTGETAGQFYKMMITGFYEHKQPDQKETRNRT